MSPATLASSAWTSEKTLIQPTPQAGISRNRQPASQSDDPISLLRAHPVFSPWFGWLDYFDPTVKKRHLNGPSLVKYGTATNSNAATRERYAWQRIFSWRKHHNSSSGFRMRDALDRVHYREKDERYVSSYDGAIRELVVQCTDDIFEGVNDAPWMRTRINNLSPFALRVAAWCAWNIEHPGVSRERKIVRRIAGTIMLSVPVSAFVMCFASLTASRHCGAPYRLAMNTPVTIAGFTTR
jgi:hypothetical protein